VYAAVVATSIAAVTVVGVLGWLEVRNKRFGW